MATLAQARILGGIGSILVLLSVVPEAGIFIGLIGFILILIAARYISDEVADRSIFNNALIAVILIFAGAIVGAAVVFAYLLRFLGGVLISPPPDPSELIGPGIFSLLAAIFAALVLIWIFFIASAIFLRRSYRAIASQLNIGMFDTVALLYLIGAVLSIVLVGFVIIYISQILQVVAFFSIPERVSQSVRVRTG